MIQKIDKIDPSNFDIAVFHLINSVSDGSAFDKSMSFNWTLSLQTGERLSYVCAPCSKQSSF
jgi:hypothetical protein